MKLRAHGVAMCQCELGVAWAAHATQSRCYDDDGVGLAPSGRGSAIAACFHRRTGHLANALAVRERDRL